MPDHIGLSPSATPFWRRNLYAAWLSQLISLTGFGFVLPFIPFYIQELGVTDPNQLRIWTGVLSSGPALGMAIMAPVWGLAADRWGKKLMMLRAMFFGAVVLSLLSAARSVTVVLVLRILQGMLTGTVTAAGALVASGTPKDKLSYALGLLSSSTFIGISIGPAVGGLTAEWLGYGPSFLIGGCLLAGGFVLVLTMVREVREPVDTVPAPSVPVGSGSKPRVGVMTYITGPMVGLLVLGFLVRLVRSFPVPFLPLYIQEIRGQLTGSATVTGVVSAARGAVTAVAALTIARHGDRRDRLLIIAVCFTIAGLLTLPSYFAGSLLWFAVFLVAATFFLGGVEPLVQAEIASRVPASKRGLLFGIQTSVTSIAWFAAPLIGTFVSIQFGIRTIFLTLAIILFITVLVVTTIRSRAR